MNPIYESILGALAGLVTAMIAVLTKRLSAWLAQRLKVDEAQAAQQLLALLDEAATRAVLEVEQTMHARPPHERFDAAVETVRSILGERWKELGPDVASIVETYIEAKVRQLKASAEPPRS